MSASWRGTRVLITGAGGFIGSHLTERLAELGASVRALVHYRGDGSWGWLDASPVARDIEVIAGDLRDQDSVRRAVAGQEVVFHLGALIAIPYSYDHPASFAQVNVLGTFHVLQAAREAGVQRVVHTSTSEVYGTAQRVPMDETHPLQAQSPYAASKIGADKFAEAFRLSYGLPVVTVRPFNTFGPRQSARAIIPTIITQGLANGTVRLGNLSPRRDLNYVSDTVEGFVLAAAAPDAVGRAINLGSGRETSIGELARMILTQLGKAGAIEQDAQRLRPKGSEVERLLADTTLARQLLGWKPAVSLEEGLRRTIEWFKEHQSLDRAQQYAV